MKYTLATDQAIGHFLAMVSQARLGQKPLTVEVVQPKRSDAQNKYLWGWLYLNIAKQLADAGIVIKLDDGREIPYDADLLHEIFKEKFLCYAEYTRTNKAGEPVTRKLCYSTAQLVKHVKNDGDELRCFATYVNNIKQFVYALWQIDIPPTYNEELLELDREVRQSA